MTVSLLRPPSSLVPPPRRESRPPRLTLRHAARSGPSVGALIAAEANRLDTDPSSRDAGAEAAWESEGGAPLPVPLFVPSGRVLVSRGR